MTAEFKCLAIETATQNFSVAVCRGEQVSVSEEINTGAQSRRLFDAIAEVLGSQKLSLTDLHCIALGIGPGAFTGLRVGAAAAQSLAFGANVRICCLSSLATLATGAARDSGASLVAACLDARMDEAYVGQYRINPAGMATPELADCLVNPDQFSIPGDDKFFAAGPGWDAFPALAQRHVDRQSGADWQRLPSAADMMVGAEQLLTAGRAVAPADALPNYVRNKVTG